MNSKKMKSFLMMILMVGSLLIGLCAVGSLSAKDDRNSRGDHYTFGDAERLLQTYPPGKVIFGTYLEQPDKFIDGQLRDGLDIRPFSIPYFADYRYCVEDWHVLALLFEQIAYGPFNPAKTRCLDLDCPSCEDCLREATFPWEQEGGENDPDPLDPYDPTDDPELIVTAQDAFAFLGRLDAVFELDGEEIQVLRTSVNRYVDTFFLPDILKAKELCEERFNMICDFRINQYAFQWGKIMAPGDLSVGEHTFKVVVTYHAASGEEFEVFNNTIRFTVYEHDEACHDSSCVPSF
jgi:hypothetical protein